MEFVFVFLQESAGHKRSNPGSSDKTTKHEPKTKKRRVTNRDEVIDS